MAVQAGKVGEDTLMFLCDKCHDEKLKLRCFHVFRSVGPCENCGKNAECVDCKSC